MPLTAAVVVATRDRPDRVGESLPLVVAAARATGAEVVLVAQGVHDVEPLARQHGAVHVADPGSGVSRARNLGAARADADVLLFTDDDCLVPTSWVREHLEALRSSEVAASFGAVGGLPRFHERDPVAEVAVHRAGTAPWFVGHSSNMAVRRDAFDQVGGFDERIGPGAQGVQAGEDADLIFRLLASGGACASGTGAPVRHLDWRSDADDARTLLAYERGAGVWIGAALRARRPHARDHLRERVHMVRYRAKDPNATDRDTGIGSLRLGTALAEGVVRGLALAPWPRQAPL